METLTTQTFSFGDFELDGAKRLLLEQGKPVLLNSKTFDLLFVLVENHGRILSKDELLEKVWTGQFVEENNLTVQISALRKILGEKKGEHFFIVTVPGKGYSFVAELNGAQPNEIVIENHSFLRIVVDEEIDEKLDWSNDFAAKQFKDSQTKRALSNRKFSVVASLVCFLTLAAIGGYVWQQSRQSTPASDTAFVKPNIRQLTNNGKVSIAALSPDGKLFAYVTSDLGLQSLWLGYTSGGNDLQLRPARETIYNDLAFSPDNNYIYFSIRDEQNPKNALYKMSAFGGGQEKILDELGAFSLAPDGNRLAFGRYDENAEKYLLLAANLNGSEERQVASSPKSRPLIFNTISWSPDVQTLAVVGARDDDKQELFTVGVSGGELKQITKQNWSGILKTAWLNDGSGIILTAVDKSSWASVVQYQVWLVATADGNSREITNDLSSYGASLGISANSDLLLTIEHRQLNNVWVAPSDDLGAARQITFSSFGRYDGLWGMDWTPDGKIIYTTSDTQSQLIAEMNADGSGQKQLTAPGFIDSVLNVSGDGRFIVFHSIRNGGFDIWRMNIDGTNLLQLTFGKKNYQPFISADNRFVYYKSWEKDKGELRRVSIDGGTPEILNDKETSWLSFSPDGKYFAAAYKTDKPRLAVFSTETNEVVKQFDLPKTGTLFMGSRWTPDSQAVIFRDNAYGYWTQTTSGGEPKRLESLPKEKFYNFAFSKDGRQFAFVRGQEIRDVVLFSNLK